MMRLKTGTKWPPGRAVSAALAVLALVLLAGPGDAYVMFDKARPGGGPTLQALDLKNHDVNAVFLMVSNQGVIGNNILTGNGTGFFPSNTSNNYVFGTGLWFDAKYDADGDGDADKVFTQGYNPLAGDSEFREGNNDQDPDDPLTRIFDSTDAADISAWPDVFRVDGEPFVRSDQDLVTTYTSQGKQPVFGLVNMPLEVNQRSMAYKTGLSAQAIFFILDVVNWGDEVLMDAWVGYDNDMDVGQAFDDDLTSFIVNRVTPEGDTIRVNMAYAWDSDFNETNFTGTPGFVGIAYLRSPGNPNDGIDNDGDGLIDESPFNGLDDDGDGKVDEADEVDELGLVNYSKHCNPSAPCQVLDPQVDSDGYDLLNCAESDNPEVFCLESTNPADIRFMMSSGPFDWEAGQSQQVVLAMVFANAVGDPSQLDFVGDPPRPDPNDPALGELLNVKDVIQGVFDLDFKQAAPPPAPNMTLVPGDGQVTILWDDLSLKAEDRTYRDFIELDPDYRQYDFQGYRVWRSRTGTFSRLGDINDPSFPLTPEAVEKNELVDGFDLTLLAQYDLADGITTEDGVTCADSIVLVDSSVVYTNCDTFNLGSDTGLRFSYVDRGEAGAPLVNGFRYFYSVTAYDFNSDALPVARLSLDSGVSFPSENSTIPRSNTSSFVDAFGSADLVDAAGNALDNTSSIFVSPNTGELDPPETVHASNALTAFTFNPGDPTKVSDAYYTIILDTFEKIDETTVRIGYHVEDDQGVTQYTGAEVVDDSTGAVVVKVSSFDLVYDGTDQTIDVAVFDPKDSSNVIFTTSLTFNVDSGDFVLPDPALHLLTVDDQGGDVSDSLGSVEIKEGFFVPMGYRASDIRMEWVAATPGSLTLNVTDLDNVVDVPFGEGIVDEGGLEVLEEKGSNWSFLPEVAAGQPGGLYFLTDTGRPIVNAAIWVAGVKLRTVVMSRPPKAGDVWTLRELAYSTQIDTTVAPPDTTWLDAQRPPVPGMRYRVDTASGGPDKGSIDLTKIRVVPNPYLATSSFELGPNQRQIQFINLPPECTIRIYTISGNLVNTLEHTPDEGGTESYDLRTRFNLMLASGNYYYHVTTPAGETHLGRFAVVQ